MSEFTVSTKVVWVLSRPLSICDIDGNVMAPAGTQVVFSGAFDDEKTGETLNIYAIISGPFKDYSVALLPNAPAEDSLVILN